MYMSPITANCTRFSGLQLVFAPASISILGPFNVGSSVPIAGRRTPRIRPTIKSPAANSAPVLPIAKRASPPPSRSSLAATTIEASLRLLTAIAGSSWLLITSFASTIFILPSGYECFASSSLIRSGFPTSMISSSSIVLTALAAASTGAHGALSPPIASMINFITADIPFRLLLCGSLYLRQGKFPSEYFKHI